MATPPPPQPMRRVLLASIAGNVLEWYDFGVFAFLAPHIGYNFFPPADPVVQIINAFIVFAGGFIMRPLGGVLFGHIGDKYGRKKALILSVVLMGGSTLGIGCLPTYYNIGVLATALLALMRLLQGLSVGGEFVGSLVFAVESAPPARRCFAGSVCTAAATGGVSLGSWTGLLLNSALSEDQMREFGWRLPFFGGLLIGVFAYWARSNLHETTPSHQEGDLHHHQSKHSPRAQGCSAAANSSLPPSSPELAASCQEAPQAPKGPARSTEEMPLRRALQEHPRAIIVATASTACYSFSVWFLTTFPPTLYGTLMQPPLAPPPQMWLLHALSSCFLSFFYPAWGWAGDAVGYVKMMLAGGVFIAIAAPPCTWMMGNGSVPMAAFGQAFLSLGLGITGGSLPAYLVSFFPPHVRYTCIALGYNFALAIFGGSAALISTSLYDYSKSTLAIGLYMSTLGAASSASVFYYVRHQRRETRGHARAAEMAEVRSPSDAL